MLLIDWGFGGGENNNNNINNKRSIHPLPSMLSQNKHTQGLPPPQVRRPPAAHLLPVPPPPAAALPGGRRHAPRASASGELQGEWGKVYGSIFLGIINNMCVCCAFFCAYICMICIINMCVCVC